VSHLRASDGTVLCEHEGDHEPEPALTLVEPAQIEQDQDHSHGLVDRSILRSRAGIRAVSWSLAILTLTALAQAFIYSRTLSVALLADLIHNFGDALTAIPLGLAFFFRSARGERLAGLAVVLAIFISALFIRAAFRISGSWLLPA
jgi:Co/Zn/Cd efflux system component